MNDKVLKKITQGPSQPLDLIMMVGFNETEKRSLQEAARLTFYPDRSLLCLEYDHVAEVEAVDGLIEGIEVLRIVLALKYASIEREIDHLPEMIDRLNPRPQAGLILTIKSGPNEKLEAALQKGKLAIRTLFEPLDDQFICNGLSWAREFSK